MTNWKTTLAGVAGLLAVISKALTVGHIDFATDGPAIMTAIGLLVAKDHSS